MTLTSVAKLADLFARPPEEIPDALREYGLAFYIAHRQPCTYRPPETPSR